MTKGIGGHQSHIMGKDEWITPPYILQALGSFDLDPCNAVKPFYKTASHSYTKLDDGLSKDWFGRVWLNPPYGSSTGKWLEKLAFHDNGIALIFARTETSMFVRHVWKCADAVMFLYGRLHFYHVDGSKASGNSGAPSCLVAYGLDNVESLYAAIDTIPGKVVVL